MDLWAIIWLSAIVFFAMMEAATVNLVSIWFVGGSLAAFITALCHGEVWLQILLFFVVSIGLLACLRPVVRRFFSPRIVPTNADRNLGKTGVVVEEIDNLNAKGQVKVGGIYWTARSENGAVIPVDTVITVKKIEGVKAIVAVAEKAAAKP